MASRTTDTQSSTAAPSVVPTQVPTRVLPPSEQPLAEDPPSPVVTLTIDGESDARPAQRAARVVARVVWDQYDQARRDGCAWFCHSVNVC